MLDPTAHHLKIKKTSHSLYRLRILNKSQRRHNQCWPMALRNRITKLHVQNTIWSVSSSSTAKQPRGMVILNVSFQLQKKLADGVAIIFSVCSAWINVAWTKNICKSQMILQLISVPRVGKEIFLKLKHYSYQIEPIQSNRK